MPTTSPDDIFYPGSTDAVAPLEATFGTLASSIQAALDKRSVYTFVENNVVDLPVAPIAREGDLAFVLTEKTFYVFDGTAWQSLADVLEPDLGTYAPDNNRLVKRNNTGAAQISNYLNILPNSGGNNYINLDQGATSTGNSYIRQMENGTTINQIGFHSQNGMYITGGGGWGTADSNAARVASAATALPLTFRMKGTSNYIPVPRVAAGTVSITGAPNTSGNITFPAGRFTQAPHVVISGTSAATSPPQDIRAVSITSTKFNAQYQRADGSSLTHTGTRNFDWIAVQV